jgi:hypothetical protein
MKRILFSQLGNEFKGGANIIDCGGCGGRANFSRSNK